MLRVDTLRLSPLPLLTLEVPDGECLTVEGASGSGKTRLLRAIADLDPAEGLVFLDGCERREVSAPEWRGMVRYVAAEPGWWCDRPRDAFAANARNSQRLQRQLGLLGLPEECLDRELSRLSTGERSRLALVRALQDDPKVLLLDEPTASLDPASAALVEDVIRNQLHARRIVLLATHDQSLAQRLSHQRLILPAPRQPHAEQAGAGAP